MSLQGNLNRLAQGLTANNVGSNKGRKRIDPSEQARRAMVTAQVLLAQASPELSKFKGEQANLNRVLGQLNTAQERIDKAKAKIAYLEGILAQDPSKIVARVEQLNEVSEQIETAFNVPQPRTVNVESVVAKAVTLYNSMLDSDISIDADESHDESED